MLFNEDLLRRLPLPMPFRGYVVVIGSRDVPPASFELLRALGTLLFAKGWCTRSGGALGSDTAAELGVKDHPHYRRGLSGGKLAMEVYLPYPNFNNHQDASAEDGYINAWELSNYTKAQSIAREIHPQGENLKPNHLVMHARNPYQILGEDLNTPSARVFFWAPPAGDGYVTGGTRTAVVLAHQHHIPRVNIAREESFEQVRHFIDFGIAKLRECSNRPQDNIGLFHR